MKENIGLFYFSGTGNTCAVANLIKEAFQKKSINVDSFPIDNLLKKKAKIELDKYTMIGIGYPIYGFREPAIIKTFENLIPQGNNKRVFIFTTGADFGLVNYNASVFLKKKLMKKGYNVFYERIFCMGSNFLVKYDEELEKKLYLAAIEKSEDLCHDVLNGEKRSNKLNIFSKGILNFIHLHEDKILAPLFGVSLKTTEECNKCGICVKNCPNNNISFKDNKIKFKSNCLLCMRCIYSCPKKAITSKFFKFIILKDGYDIDVIVNNEDISEESKTKKATTYRKHFDSYLNDISK